MYRQKRMSVDEGEMPADHENSAPQKSPGAKPSGSRQQSVHSGIGDLASRLVRNVRARSVVHPFFKSCSMQWNRRRSTNPAWTGCIGTISARIGIRLSARTMAGAHITEATPPTKMRLRVSIEPPNINVR